MATKKNAPSAADINPNDCPKWVSEKAAPELVVQATGWDIERAKAWLALQKASGRLEVGFGGGWKDGRQTLFARWHFTSASILDALKVTQKGPAPAKRGPKPKYDWPKVLQIAVDRRPDLATLSRKPRNTVIQKVAQELDSDLGLEEPADTTIDDAIERHGIPKRNGVR